MLKDHFYPHPSPQCGALQKVVWLPKTFPFTGFWQSEISVEK